MKKRNLLLVMLAVLLAFGLVIGCDLEPGNGEPGEEEWTPDDGFFGTYEAQYNSLIETIVFEKDKFTISDDSKTNGVLNGDFLEFAIEYFDEITNIPDDFKTDYPKGFVFKGKITDAKPIAADTATNKNIYGNQTGPNLSQSDINKTYLKMFIYYNDSGTKFTFIRTAFVKDSDPTPNVIRVSTAAGAALRIYEEQ